MKNWTGYFQTMYFQKILRHRIVVALAAGALAFSFAAYEFASPAKAAERVASESRAAESGAAAEPLSSNSVSALLSLDQAMEAVAARVTPAVVNVAVASKNQAETSGRMGPGMMGPGGNENGNGNGNENGTPFDLPPQLAPFFHFGQPGQQQSQIEHGQGSGVILSPDGYIVTNNHVVEGAVDITVTTSDRRIFPGKVVGADPLTDLAVIKIDATRLPYVSFGNSAALHPGQTVLAFGNPLGMRFTVTRGIVSALNRPNPMAANRRSPGEFIQTDAAINPGNSGGPLVNAYGEVIGINTFLVSQTGGFSGMGFAIPSQIVQPIAESLIQNGKVSHGYIGIGIGDLTPDEAMFFHVTSANGAVVTQVEPDTPGAKAGLKVGDIITAINGKQVSGAGELQMLVELKRPGTELRLTTLRDGKSMDVPVTLGNMAKGGEEESAEAGHGKPRWGLGLEDLTPALRQQVNAGSDVHGAVIEQVTPGSPADNAGLESGEVITEVNRHPVFSAADVQKALAGVAKDSDALVLVWSKEGSSFRVLHPAQG